MDKVIEARKAGLDGTLPRENLKISREQRLVQPTRLLEFHRDLGNARRKLRKTPRRS